MQIGIRVWQIIVSVMTVKLTVIMTVLKVSNMANPKDLEKARRYSELMKQGKYDKARKIDLSGASLRGADLSDANLSDANLSDAHISGAIIMPYK